MIWVLLCKTVLRIRYSIDSRLQLMININLFVFSLFYFPFEFVICYIPIFCMIIRSKLEHSGFFCEALDSACLNKNSDEDPHANFLELLLRWVGQVFQIAIKGL